MSKYSVRVTSELRPGDIVVEHGMRLLIDGEMKISRSHPDSPAGDGKTRYYGALLLNRDDVPHEVVPFGWTREPNDEHRWTIQGNDLARWYVEEATA